MLLDLFAIIFLLLSALLLGLSDGELLMVFEEVGVLLHLMLIGLRDHFLAYLRLLPLFGVIPAQVIEIIRRWHEMRTRFAHATILILKHHSEEALSPTSPHGLGDAGLLVGLARPATHQVLIGYRRGVACHLDLREGVITFWIVIFI